MWGRGNQKVKKEFLRFWAGMKQLVGCEGLATKTGNTIGRIGLEGNQRFCFGLSESEVPVIPPAGSCKIHLVVHLAECHTARKAGETGHES